MNILKSLVLGSTVLFSLSALATPPPCEMDPYCRLSEELGPETIERLKKFEASSKLGLDHKIPHGEYIMEFRTPELNLKEFREYSEARNRVGTYIQENRSLNFESYREELAKMYSEKRREEDTALGRGFWDVFKVDIANHYVSALPSTRFEMVSLLKPADLQLLLCGLGLLSAQASEEGNIDSIEMIDTALIELSQHVAGTKLMSKPETLKKVEMIMLHSPGPNLDFLKSSPVSDFYRSGAIYRFLKENPDLLRSMMDK